MQKLGSNPKAMEWCHEHNVRQHCIEQPQAQPGEQRQKPQILLRLAKLAFGATIKWTRKMKQDVQRQEVLGAEASQVVDERRAYALRTLACTRCLDPQETRWMQLRTKIGYRAPHCKAAGKQERVARNLCQCGVAWHRCVVHRVNPVIHSSRKGIKRTKKEDGPKGKRVSSSRPAPEVWDD